MTRVACVDTRRDRLIWQPGNSTLPELDLRDSLKLKSYLGVHGLEIQKGHPQVTVPPPWLKFGAELLQSEDIVRQAIPVMATTALQAGADGALCHHHLHASPAWGKLVDHATEAGCLAHREGRHHLVSPAARTFLAGGWLENAVFQTVLNLKGRIPLHDALLGMTVSGEDGVGNEFDVAFLADNQLILIECKARSVASEKYAGAAALYKIDSIRGLGGLHAKGMLVTLYELPKRARDRAHAFGIRLVSRNELSRLPDHVVAMVNDAP